MIVAATKLCNDVLTRVRQPGPPGDGRMEVPKTFMAGAVLENRAGLRYRIRFFCLIEGRLVFAKVHLVGTRQDTTIWLGNEGDFAEKLVLGGRYCP